MIEVRNLHKQFGNKEVLRGVTMNVQNGETMVIIGRSGCGKSVMTKLIVGLLTPDKGEVRIDGKIVEDMTPKELAAMRQKIGLVFQGAALFDSLTVGENIGLALHEVYHMTNGEINKIVAEKLEMVGLPEIQHLKPSELSGGMRKRVGLARALATNPQYIFYDEPTTGLDPIMSDAIDSLISKLAIELKVTSIVITHDMQSVYKVADRVTMLEGGQVYFRGSIDQLRETPDPVVRNFVDRNSYHDGGIEIEIERFKVLEAQLRKEEELQQEKERREQRKKGGILGLTNKTNEP
ncbi:MAG: ABC transporter ATP-binding protein [Chloroherpetonaceae bacterium]|nr:ABC transporter ATP-binding protein [Chloroherpetonaceae bacterium]